MHISEGNLVEGWEFCAGSCSSEWSHAMVPAVVFEINGSKDYTSHLFGVKDVLLVLLNP